MTEVIDPCSSRDEDEGSPQRPLAPTRHQTQSSSQRPLPLAAGTLTDRIRSSGPPPVPFRASDLKSSPTKLGLDTGKLSEGGQSSSRSLSTSKGPPSGPVPSLNSAEGAPKKASTPRNDSEQRPPSEGTRPPSEVARRGGLSVTGFRKPQLLSSDATSPSIPVSVPERGQKRAHNDKVPLSFYIPLKKRKEARSTHPLASAPSSKARYGRPAATLPSAGTKRSSAIDLTLDEDEDVNAATSSDRRVDRSHTTAFQSPKATLSPARPSDKLDQARPRTQPSRPPAASRSPRNVSYGHRSPQPPSASPSVASSARLSCGASVRRGTEGQHPLTRKSPGSLLGVQSGTTPTEVRATITGVLPRPRSSVRPSDSRSLRRSTIPESPPLSPSPTRETQSSSNPSKDSTGFPSSRPAAHMQASHPGSTAHQLTSSGDSIRHVQPPAIGNDVDHREMNAFTQPQTVHYTNREAGQDSTSESMSSNALPPSRPPSHLERQEQDVCPLPTSSHKPSQGDSTSNDLVALLQADAKQHSNRVKPTASHLPRPDMPPPCALPATLSSLPGAPDSLKRTAPTPIASKSCDSEFHRSTQTGPPDTRSASPLSTRNIERLVGQYVEEMRNDNEHWTRVELQRARTRGNQRCKTTTSSRATSVFSNLTPVVLAPSSSKGIVPAGCARFTSELHPVASKSAKSSWHATCTTYNTSETVEVPRYSHYVSISQNLLANNVTSLQHWPYFGDDFDISKAYALNKEYYIDVDGRERKLLRLGQAESFAVYADDLLTSAGVNWSDVLRFMLDLKPDVGVSPDAIKSMRDREKFISEDFIRDGGRWGEVLAKLPAAQPERVGRAAVICDHFQRIAKFPFWHVVRRSSYTKTLVAHIAGVTDNERLTCRICMRFSCPHHGEIRDHPDRSKESSDAENETVETDIILPQVVNFRTRVMIPETVDSEPVATDKRRTLDYWEKGPFGNLKWKADERGPFYPCHHPGISCSDARCSCFDARIACEKTCSCGPGCKRKWKGCLCHSGKRQKGKSVCWDDDRCACFQKSRECDPDLCGDCGVADILDPVHRHDDRVLTSRCRMASIQRGVPKHTILGDSGVHGLGLYACEDIRQDEFVGEYKGETITKDEAERRGAVYEHQKLSYLFTLNSYQEIDSTYFGNKVRFINHVDGSKSNLKPLIIMVNSVFRIGMYAKKKIRAGEEFFFDYGPSFPKDQLGGKAVKPAKFSKSAPHVRNAGHVRDDFYDIDISRDQLGNLRATKAVGLSSSDDDQETRRETERKAPSKKRGGARSGAGRPRKPRHHVEENRAAQQPPTEDNLDHMDAQQRLSMYNVLEGSADDEDFEPEEDSMSEVDIESESD
ncbi:Putative SET domain, CXC domain, histone-lysine N-methyltransferase EZH1/2 [Septoria linicola]|uniref:SET domain, CXC domain, histone-lysine N-methyltransferase EZH1/2 n=1 Tax=Septoria linicola TaxID=215465 RepID=A0A9Q9EE93_9PEZI|nr:putative SET domain, CXC domain, histone-lysine N-methyltransferase EZH1/2 [Septoria linicola]USW47640.1 Putative SET domain, CXC domain, histone-lysine N-methyltransferase EZH1/2 [Septoria linicola]